MTKANDLASLLDANGDVVSSALDNVPASNDASALSTGTLAAARLPADIVVSDASPELSADLATNSNNINFGTNAKSNYGTSAQLMMYHDGSNGWIKGNNAGNNSIAIQSGGTGSVMISGSSGQNIISQQGDAAHLHYAGFTKANTTATGLDVTGSVTATGIIEASDGTNGEMQFGLGTALTTGAGTYDSSVRWNGSSGNLLFSQGAVEKMRISSDNLLVGTTGALITGTAKLSVNGQIEAVTSSTPVIDVARSDGAGTIINLRQGGGAVVGRIGVGNTNRLFIGSSDTGIMFDANNNAIYPWNTTTNGVPASDQVKLGYNATGLRFSNIHLNGRVSYDGSGGVRIDGTNHAYIRKKGTHQYQFDCGSFTAGQGKKIFTTNSWTAGGGSITVFQNAGFFGVGQFSFILHYGGCAFTLQHGTTNYATFSVNLNTPSSGRTEVFLTMGYAMSDVRIFLNFDGYPYYGSGALINSVGSGITMTEVAHHSLA